MSIVFDERWEKKFQELVKFQQQEGHCRVRRQHPLGLWVSTQRQVYKEKGGALPGRRVARLQRLGFEWGTAQASWEGRFRELVQYRKETGHFSVPRDTPLGRWAKMQRSKYKTNGGSLPGNRAARLEGIGFDWRPSETSVKRTWEGRFRELVQYREETGHFSVPNDNPLGYWTKEQRYKYKQNGGSLLGNRAARLEGIGFDWRWTPSETRVKRTRLADGEHSIASSSSSSSLSSSSSDDDDGDNDDDVGHGDDGDDGEDAPITTKRTKKRSGNSAPSSSSASASDDDSAPTRQSRKKTPSSAPKSPRPRERRGGDGNADGGARTRAPAEPPGERRVNVTRPANGMHIGVRGTVVGVGDVGYAFRKQFDDGWYTGNVVKIRAGAEGGRDRRCLYEDGDSEDLSLHDLRTLALLDPKKRTKRKAYSKNSPKKGQVPTDGTPSLNHQATSTKESNRPANPKYITMSKRVAELKAYKEKHGHFHFSREDNSSLATFARQCRHAIQGPKTAPMTLSERQIWMLDNIGFWSAESNNTAKPTTSTTDAPIDAAANFKESSKSNSSPNTHHQIAAVSAYVGVSYSKTQRKYLAQKQSDGGKLHHLGYYKFEADAALAVDKGSMLGSKEECNFTTRHQYENSVRAVMEAAGRPVDVEERHDAVVEKVGVYLSKIYAKKNREVAAAELGNSKKTGDGADDEVGNYEAEDGSGGAVETTERELLSENLPNGTGSGQNRKHIGKEEAMSSLAIATKEIETVSKASCPKLDSERASSTRTEASDMDSKSQSKHSEFIGVAYDRYSETYYAQIGHDNKKYFLGSYSLQTDAAMAYDKAAKLLRGTDSIVNLRSRQNYICKRAEELGESERGSESLAEIAKKIRKYLLKIPTPCPELDLINDAMAKKWAHYLPSETGQEFRESYQEKIHDLLLSGEPQRNKFDPPAPSLTNCGMESVQGKTPDEFSSGNIRFPSTGSPQLSRHSKPHGSSDDDTSLSSNTERDDNADLPESNSAAVSPASDVSDTGSSGLNNICIEPESFKKFPMPIGCPVLWNFNCKSFRRGVVISPTIHGTSGDTAYKVMPAKSSKNEPSMVIPARELAFGIDCPVYVVRDSSALKSHLLEGKILFCMPVPVSANYLQGTLFLYTILIVKEGNQFQVMNDIPSPLVRYRKEKEVLVPNNGKGKLAASPEAMGENNQKGGHKFFSSNSTITSDDSTPASSRRVVRGSARELKLKLL